MDASGDIAGADYWTDFWKQQNLPEEISLNKFNPNNHPFREYDAFFEKAFEGTETKGLKLLEIGGGNSVFLGYFYKRFHFSVFALDYSEVACERTKAIFKRDNIPGEVLFGDAFSPSPELLEKFDVVVSLGVVEHFEDTTKTVLSFSRFLKPGGILITSIPNLCGFTGFFQKHLNRPVYDVHKIMDKVYLDNAVEKANLKIFHSVYFVSISLAITLEGKDNLKIPHYSLKKFFVKTVRQFIKVIWILQEAGLPVPAGKLLSGGIINAARKAR